MYYRYENTDILKRAKSPFEIFDNMNVYLVRHGESVSNALQKRLKEDGKILDEDQKLEDAKITLTEKGIWESKEVGEKLAKHLNLNSKEMKKTLVLVSPYERARETFENANEFMKFDFEDDNVFVLNDLREQSYGAFSMIDKSIKRKNYGNIYDECQRSTLSFFKPQLLGESPADVASRLDSVITFIEKFNAKSPIKNVVVFAHRNVNKCMLMKILNLPAEFYDDFDQSKNAHVICVEKGKFKEIDF